MKKTVISVLLLCLCAMGSYAQVSVSATGGTLSGSYTTLGGAFAAINAGTHTGSIAIGISANTSETGPCVLHSSGAGSASYTALSIRPTADGVTISGATATGRGLIELNGADNVTIDGDNAGTTGTNRNLTITNTAANTVTYTSVIRIATSGSVTTADNNIIRNCIINGSSTSGNASANTSATGAFATSWGIYAGGNGGTTATSDPAALTSTTANTSASGQTINALQVTNNQVNTCARAIAFMGGASTVAASGITVTNNVIGATATVTGNAPYTTPASTVYVKGILVLGAAGVTITGNTIQNIISYVAFDHTGIELNANIGSGTINISNNTITNIAVNTGSFRAAGIYVLSAGGPYTVAGNTITNMQNLAGSSSLIPEGIEVNTGAASGLIDKNKITKVYNNSTGAWTATGIFLNGGSNITVQNNFISDVNVYAGNTVTSTSFLPSGIKINSGTGHKIYHNSINLYGAALGGTTANGTACLMIVNSSSTGIDIRNNILSNQFSGWPSGSVHACLFLPSGQTSSFGLTINNNAYYAPTGNFIAQLSSGTTYTAANFVASAITPATNLRSYTSLLTTSGNNDNSSFAFTSAPPFVSSTDLHIPAATSTVLESSAASVGVTSDIDGQVRPGPAGSVNGGGIIADIGADEFDGIPIDASAPGITYTALSTSTCSTGDRTITGVTITDASGVPTTGSLVPRVYFRKNSGSWFSAPGTLTSGTGTSGTWSFTIAAATMSGLAVGDVVSYYIIAQDVAATPNIAANPGGGLVATNVNTVTTPPGTLNTFTIGGSLGGNYNIGASGAYTTLTAAVNAYNSACLTGAVTFSLTDAAYTSETFPITINANSFASASNTLTIRPATGVSASISGSNSSSIFIFNGADYVIIDGSNNPVTNSICPPIAASRNLTITNTNTGTSSAVVWLQNNGSDGATNNVVRNANIVGSGNTQTLIGIGSGSNSISITSLGNGNNNNRYENNNISKTQYGIYSTGASAATKNTGTVINQNLINTAAPDNVAKEGIRVGYEDNISISANRVANMNGTGSPDVFGINVGYTAMGTTATTGNDVTNATITNNVIQNIVNSGTFSATGLAVAAVSSGTTLIANNMITGVAANGTSGDMGCGIVLGGGSGTTNVYYNTVVQNGAITGSTSGSQVSAALAVTASSAPVLNLRDNIFVNTQTPNSGGTTKFVSVALGYTSTVGAYATLTSNNNDLYVSSGANYFVGIVGGLVSGTTKTTLANWQAETGTDAASVSVNPIFVSASDAHLQALGGNVALISGTPVSGITRDIDCTTRNATTTVIGAHEVSIPLCTGTPTAGTVSASTLTSCATFTTTLTTTGTTSGLLGLTYQWQSSPTGTGYTSITGATNTSYTATVTSSTYYRMIIGCSNSGNADTTTGLQVVSNPNPSSITGVGSTCVGSSLTLAATPAGGTWSSGATATGTINATTGVFTGVATGTSTVTYTLGTGCFATAVATVSPSPSAITITPALSQTICLNSTVTFTAAATATAPLVQVLANDFNSGLGGWSVDNSGSSGGSSPAATQWSSYANGASLASTVHNSPDGTSFAAAVADAGGSGSTTQSRLISPVFSLAGYTSATLTFQHFYRYISTDVSANAEISTDGGSSWITLQNFRTGAANVGSATSFANASFDLTPYAGQANCRIRFFYSAGWGWSWSVDNVKVMAVPPPSITWSGVSGTDGLSCTSCTSPSVTPTTSGTKTYSVVATAAGCSSSATVTVSVNPLPAPIGGGLAVCQGLTTTITNADAGGTWSSQNTAIATVGSASGVLTGIAPGTTNVTYTFTGTGCRRIGVVTVNALPAPIAGTASVCVTASTTLSNSDAGGTWTSGTLPIATIGTNGVVTGIGAGLSVITYTLPTGCIRTRIATVNPVPVVNITPATAAAICEGESTVFTANSPAMEFSLLNQDFNSGLGTWTITNLVGDPSNFWHIATSPYVPSGTSGDGTPLLEAVSDAPPGGIVHTIFTSPVFSTISYGSATLSFNQNLLSISTADNIVAVEYSTDSGTTWHLLLDQLDQSVGTGSWTASAPEISIPLPSDALGVEGVQLRWNYASNFGLWWQIDNISVKASFPAATYTWATTGSADGLSCTSCATTTVTPTVPGVNVYNVTASSVCSTTVPVTVTLNPLPASISGTTALLCTGSSITLGNADAGGSWVSGNTSIASIDATTGIVTGNTAGTATITYTLPTSCARTTVITVNQAPSSITGTMHVCETLTTTLANTVTGGTWTSSNTAVGSVDAAGVATGITAGTTAVTYTLPGGCSANSMLTVYPTPLPIGGTLEVCEGQSTTLSNGSSGGTWMSVSTGIASVNTTTGIVNGILAGTTTIAYTLPEGCQSVAQFTVNALPAGITGTTQVCEGLTTSLTSATTGGTWTSSNTAVGTIDASGTLTGIAAGNTAVSYTLGTGCYKTAMVVVNPVPAAITGTAEVCEEGSVSLNNATTGGLWSVTDTMVAAIDSTGGLVTGIAAGNTDVTYMLPTGCISTRTLTVNALPAGITGTMVVCEGLTTSLSNTTTGGTWTSSNTAVGTIDASGTLTGIAAGNTAVSYTLGTGCYKTATVVVNPVPAAITGTAEVCEESSVSLNNATSGGLWSVTDTMVASIDSVSGLAMGISAGNTDVTYMLPTGCISTRILTVNALPASITGGLEVCEGSATALATTSTGGNWSSDNTTVATINAAGTVTALAMGTTNIVYAFSTGCQKMVTLTVDPLPAAITGTTIVCEGFTTTLANATSDGYWSTGTGITLAIDSATGIVSGLAAGTAPVSYILPTGCFRSVDVLVNPLPAAITGSTEACAGTTATLTSATTGGAWSNDASGAATVDATGIVTASAAGSTGITYTLPATGCLRAVVFSVNALPTVYNVTGGGAYCAGTSGAAVGADGSQSGITYQLYLGGAATGAPFAGTGAPFSIGGYTTPGTYTIIAHNTATGCESNLAGSAVIAITPTVVPTVALSTGSLTVCASTATVFTAAPVNGGTLPVYNWQVNGTPSPGATSATFTYAPVNGDVVTVQLNSNAVCATPATATDSLTMTVNPNQMPVATVTGPGPIICDGSMATFNVTSVYGGTAPSYAWYKNGVATGVTGTGYTYTPVSGDVVSAKLTSNFTCRLADVVTSNSLVVATTPISLPIVNITAAPGLFITSGTPVTFTAIVSGGGASPTYEWYLNGSLVPGATSATFTSSTLHNNDSVSCRVMGTAPCAYENYNSVRMYVKPGVGVAQLSGAADIRLVPNPNAGEFTIRGTMPQQQDDEVSMDITNMLGQVVYKANIATKAGMVSERIKLSNNLANGMYMLNMRTATEHVVINFVLEQ